MAGAFVLIAIMAFLAAILLFIAWIAEPDKFVEALRAIRGGKK